MEKYASSELIIKMLPFLDSLESAVNHEDESAEILQKQFLEILTGAGLLVMQPVNNEFDPNMHEVLMKDNTLRVADNVVTECLQTGYMLGERVLRFAKVKVNKNDNKGNTAE